MANNSSSYGLLDALTLNISEVKPEPLDDDTEEFLPS